MKSQSSRPVAHGPARPETFPFVLPRSLTTGVPLRNRRAARRTSLFKWRSVRDNQEPDSPHVTCAGKVHVAASGSASPACQCIRMSSSKDRKQPFSWRRLFPFLGRSSRVPPEVERTAEKGQDKLPRVTPSACSSPSKALTRSRSDPLGDRARFWEGERVVEMMVVEEEEAEEKFRNEKGDGSSTVEGEEEVAAEVEVETEAEIEAEVAEPRPSVLTSCNSETVTENLPARPPPTLHERLDMVERDESRIVEEETCKP